VQLSDVFVKVLKRSKPTDLTLDVQQRLVYFSTQAFNYPEKPLKIFSYKFPCPNVCRVPIRVICHFF